ncbi:MAG: phosphatase PAP2-related protein [Pirellulales bacterium]
MFETPWPIVGVRFGFVVVGILAWYWTQSIIGKRVPKVAVEVPLTDGIHVLTERLHRRYATNIAAGNRLLIISSLVIDLLGAYLLGSAIFGESIRPFVGLLMVFSLRQVCQLLCPLPAPAGMVWRYPGVPAVLVTYGTANDLFFSGHTSIAVYGAATLAGHWGTSGLVLGLLIAIFEATTVLILRAHYTMDVFTGIVCALWVYSLSGPAAAWIDGLILQWVG